MWLRVVWCISEDVSEEALHSTSGCKIKLKLETASSFETSVTVYETTRSHIPEDTSLHSYGCENLTYRCSWLVIFTSRPLYLREPQSRFWHGAENKFKKPSSYKNRTCMCATCPTQRPHASRFVRSNYISIHIHVKYFTCFSKISKFNPNNSCFLW